MGSEMGVPMKNRGSDKCPGEFVDVKHLPGSRADRLVAPGGIHGARITAKGVAVVRAVDALAELSRADQFDAWRTVGIMLGMCEEL